MKGIGQAPKSFCLVCPLVVVWLGKQMRSFGPKKGPGFRISAKTVTQRSKIQDLSWSEDVFFEGIQEQLQSSSCGLLQGVVS
jgi:hypothetical protein